MTNASPPDRFHDYLSAAIEAAHRDDLDPQITTDLTAEERTLADRALSEMRNAELGDIEAVPFAEDPIAVRLGLVAAPPLVVVNAAAIEAALHGQDMKVLEHQLVSYGQTVDRAWLEGLAGGRVGELEPQLLRTLAALLDTEPGTLVENQVEPYPVDQVADLAAQLEEPWHTEIHGEEVHIASSEHRLGVLVAHVGGAEHLDALNVRRAAWELLTTRWIRHNACVIMSPADSYASIVIDAIDCQPHQHAPTGVLTYGPSHAASPVGEALSEYTARFRVTWTPPQRLDDDLLTERLIPEGALDGIPDLLTGSFAQPKRSAFSSVRDVLARVSTEEWEQLVLTVHGVDDPDSVDAALEMFTSS